ncbi:hypothetical protein CDAR_280351 [Caerostris darwini]|uniref:Uncharacterized protein n=1 Tax=Caerostris darwini TaxID=1538125 RepID=A0AAV4VG36_9ARAC|nr:hypothetical protein CDAR_280351 [Caerostris darwini]
MQTKNYKAETAMSYCHRLGDELNSLTPGKSGIYIPMIQTKEIQIVCWRSNLEYARGTKACLLCKATHKNKTFSNSANARTKIGLPKDSGKTEFLMLSL